jgi:hypothetical protein
MPKLSDNEFQNECGEFAPTDYFVDFAFYSHYCSCYPCNSPFPLSKRRLLVFFFVFFSSKTAYNKKKNVGIEFLQLKDRKGGK